VRSDALLDEALKLPDDERASLALRLAQSLDGPPQPESEAAWAKEIARRVERLRDGTARVVAGADAIARARVDVAARRA
jgi:putative addiction module component (TIGR02574 family)